MTGQNILTATHVSEAIRIMYPFTHNQAENNVKDILKHVGLFDYRTVDALVECGSEEELLQLIDESAKAVVSYYSTLEENKKHQVKWNEHKEKMIHGINSQFEELFAKAQATVRQINLKEKFTNRIKSDVERVKRFVSALIDTEEKVQDAKSQIDELFTKLKGEITASDLHQSTKEDLIVAIDAKAIKDCYDFVDVKFTETPVHVLYYRTGSRVSVKVNLQKNGYTYTQGRGKEVRWNKGKDREQFPLIVSALYIEDFLYQNKVRDEDILVDANSVDQFYSFDSGHVSVNLTPSFVAEWYNYDAPYLYRHTPNKHRHTNMLGMPICHFSNRLVEASWSDTYIDEDITEQEVEALAKGYEHTGITKEMRNVLKARKAKEAGQEEALREYVESFDARIQKVIDSNASVILQRLAQAFPSRMQMATGTDGQAVFRMNDDFGLDCGFINIKPMHSEYMEKRSLLRNIDRSVAPWMNISLPYGTQSTTVQKEMFNIAKEFVLKETGIQLTANTVLD